MARTERRMSKTLPNCRLSELCLKPAIPRELKPHPAMGIIGSAMPSFSAGGDF
jgi:hypothetical protein